MNIAFAAELIYRHISLFTSSGYIAYQVFYYFFSVYIYHLLDFRYFTEYNYTIIFQLILTYRPIKMHNQIRRPV